jgi:small-conductance mechanosensitive channel
MKELGVAFLDQLNISPWIGIPLVFFIWVLVLATVKKTIFILARKLAFGTKTQVDDILFDALDFPIQLVIYASGLLVVQSLIPKETLDVMAHLVLGFKIVCIIAAAMFAEKFLNGLIRIYADRFEIFKTSGNLANGLVRLAVLGLGGLVILDSLGISITPIIASLGIGSLAVALALQPTLENFFSGIQLVADKPVQIGQFVKLESGEEGTVTKIGWRSTWITMPNNNTIVIPNKMLVNTRLLNYFYPDMEIAVPVSVGVHYNSDLDKVEHVTVEVARETMKEVPGGVPSFEPFIRYHTFADFSINFNAILRAKDWPSTHLVKHEFIKRLQKRYAKEGISIPYPIQTVLHEK